MGGVELACWMKHDAHGRPAEAVIVGADGAELRFAPGGDRRDARGAAWSVEGDPEVLGMEVRGERLVAREYPDALARVWAALACPGSGDVLLSAAPDYEFVDWGGQAHLRGGSHGSLRGEDSNTALIMCGLDPPRPEPRHVDDLRRRPARARALRCRRGD